MKAPTPLALTLPIEPRKPAAKVPHIYSRRRQPIRPHRLLTPLIEMLRELSELYDGIADVTDDAGHFREAAALVERARAILRNDAR